MPNSKKLKDLYLDVLKKDDKKNKSSQEEIFKFLSLKNTKCEQEFKSKIKVVTGDLYYVARCPKQLLLLYSKVKTPYPVTVTGNKNLCILIEEKDSYPNLVFFNFHSNTYIKFGWQESQDYTVDKV